MAPSDTKPVAPTIQAGCQTSRRNAMRSPKPAYSGRARALRRSIRRRRQGSHSDPALTRHKSVPLPQHGNRRDQPEQEEGHRRNKRRRSPMARAPARKGPRIGRSAPTRRRVSCPPAGAVSVNGSGPGAGDQAAEPALAPAVLGQRVLKRSAIEIRPIDRQKPNSLYAACPARIGQPLLPLVRMMNRDRAAPQIHVWRCISWPTCRSP